MIAYFLNLLTMSPFWHINVHAHCFFLLGFLHYWCGASWCHIGRRYSIHVDNFWRLRWLLFTSLWLKWWSDISSRSSASLSWLSQFGWCHGGRDVPRPSLVALITSATSLSALYTLSLYAFLNFIITLSILACFPYIEFGETSQRHYPTCVLNEPILPMYLPLISLVITSWYD
jgi:hypothetical protein